MPKSTKRPNQVAEIIQQGLVMLLVRQTKDPRLQSLTITSVDVSPDLKSARVYFTVMDATVLLADVKKSLAKASGFFRSQLAQELNLRYMPKLEFIYDKTWDAANRISDLLANIDDKPKDED